VASSAVLAVRHSCHENTSTTSFSGAFTPQSLDLPVTVNFVVFQHGQLGLLSLVLDLLGSSVDLLLSLLSTSSQSQDEMESGLFLDIVVGESSAVFELFAGEDQTLLIGWDALLILDFGLDIVDGVGGFDLEGDGLTREGFDEDLHGDGILSRTDASPSE